MAEPVIINPEWDEPVKTRLVPDGDRLVGEIIQPGATVMLDGIKTIRDNRLAKTLDWGRAELEIPIIQLENLKRRYPELGSPDHETKTRAWKRFAASPESLPYRVRGRGRFLARSVGGI
jgi:hypothetical protein